MIRNFAPLAMLLLLASCGSNDFTCSSAPVVEKLTEFVRNANS